MKADQLTLPWMQETFGGLKSIRETDNLALGIARINSFTFTGTGPPGPAATVTLSLSGSPLAENGGIGTVTATLSAPSFQPVNVDLELGGTAESTDYSIIGLQIVVPAGNTSVDLEILAIDDQLDEDDETITVAIMDVANGSHDGQQEVSAVILDDDDPPSLTPTGLTANAISVQEGDMGTSVTSITVSLSNASEKGISARQGQGTKGRTGQTAILPIFSTVNCFAKQNITPKGFGCVT